MSTKSLIRVMALALISLLVPRGNVAHAALTSILSNIGPQAVLICDGDNTDKECTVTVIVEDKGDKKCTLNIDYPVAVVTAGSANGKSLKLRWDLVRAGGSSGNYKFDSFNGIDIAGDKDNHFGEGTPDGNAKFKIPRNKGTASKKAFNYTVTVLRKVGSGPSDWAICGVVDPIIVNRD